MPERIQRRRTAGWRMPAGAVNCTRPCDWSNPFRVGDTFRIHNADDVPRQGLVTPKLAVALFRVYVTDRWEEQIRRELAGRDLVCWCSLDSPWCHVDVLLETANGEPQ